MSYLVEMHYHTPETSGCCKASPAEAFPRYADYGYHAIVITDHYFDGWFERQPHMSWQEKINRWLAGARTAQDVAVSYGLHIILGMELRFQKNWNDYLLYGFDESFLLQYPTLYKMNPQSMRRLADEKGFFFAQAHPFRGGCKPVNPASLHGVEVFNGNPRHDSRNPMAEDFAKKNGLIPIAGSDFHQIEDACQGGMFFSKPPSDSKDLAYLLRNGFAKKIMINPQKAPAL